jgi:hypothetical protein
MGLVVAGGLLFGGCGGGPSPREIQNARAFEALLTAVSLKDRAELEKDARTVEHHHERGDLSDPNYAVLTEIIARARKGDWSAAEAQAYKFREQFGDRGAYFR